MATQMVISLNLKCRNLQGIAYTREHDKDPDTFFSVLFQLQELDCAFNVSVIGQSYEEIPSIKKKTSKCYSPLETLVRDFF